MSDLAELAATVGAIGSDASRMSVELYQRAQELKRTAHQLEQVLRESRRPDASFAAQSLLHAATACEQASQMLTLARREGDRYALGVVSSRAGAGAGAIPSRDAVTPDGTAAGGGDGRLGAELGSRGLELADVSSLTNDDNPITDSFDRHGMSRPDYAWVVETWRDVVAPGIASGSTREDFAQLDASADAPANRRVAAVYDIFLGSEQIVVSRSGDGPPTVTNGRHRIEMAHDLGVDFLPVRFV